MLLKRDTSQGAYLDSIVVKPRDYALYSLYQKEAQLFLFW